MVGKGLLVGRMGRTGRRERVILGWAGVHLVCVIPRAWWVEIMCFDDALVVSAEACVFGV